MSLRDAWLDRKVRVAAALASIGVLWWIVGIGAGMRAASRSNGYYPVRAARLLDDEKGQTNKGTQNAYYVEYTAQNGQKYRFPEPLPRMSFRDGEPDLGVELYVSKADPSDAWLVSDGRPSMIGAAIGFFLGAVFLCIACVVGLRPLQAACRKAEDADAPEGTVAPAEPPAPASEATDKPAQS